MPASVLSICYVERGNESHLLPDLSYIREIIYFFLANDRFGIHHVQSSRNGSALWGYARTVADTRAALSC